MIDQKEGETDLTIKTDFNGMVSTRASPGPLLFSTIFLTMLLLLLVQRVATRRNKYFYNPIYGTPFSLALALPEGYGMYEAVGEEEIKRSTVNRE